MRLTYHTLEHLQRNLQRKKKLSSRTCTIIARAAQNLSATRTQLQQGGHTGRASHSARTYFSPIVDSLRSVVPARMGSMGP